MVWDEVPKLDPTLLPCECQLSCKIIDYGLIVVAPVDVCEEGARY